MLTMMNSPYTNKKSQGATLLEVMVALVIMAFGLLGLAGLQATGMSTNSNAERRTQATIVANDFIERMRANRPAVNAGDYATVDFANLDCALPPAAYCEDRPGTQATICNSQELATFDTFVASCDANTKLPGAALNVRCTDNTGLDQVCNVTPFRTLTVNWSNMENNAIVNKSMTLIFRP